MTTDASDPTGHIISAAIDVHRALGPGLLESAYQKCLAFELVQRGHSVKTEEPLPLIYRGTSMGCGYRLDMLVDESAVVEIKSVERFEPIHTAQLIAYLRLSGCKVGLLLNFNTKWLADHGIKRVVLGFPDGSSRAWRAWR